MNYCTGCGTKLMKNDKFCTKCGLKIITEEDKLEMKKKNDKKNQNIILLLGIFLVLFSTFALGIITWKSLNEIFRLSFFGFECLLFFGLGYVIKKLTDNKMYRVFYIVGLILIPYTLTLIPYYGLLSDYFNKGPGLFIYLSIIYFITFLIYIFANHGFKSGFVNFISLLVLLAAFVFVALIFSDSFVLITLLITIYLLFICLFSYLKVFNEDLRKIMNVFSSVLLVINCFIIFVSIMSGETLVNNIISTISMLIYMFIGYLKIYKTDNSAFQGLLPFGFALLTFACTDVFFIKNAEITCYIYTIVSLILYFVSLLFNKKVFSNITLGITYSSIALIMITSVFSEYHLAFLIISIILLLFNIFNIIISKINWINYLIPFNIFLIITATSLLTVNFKMIYILLITALVFLLIYVVLKIINNKHSLTYLITAYSLGMISMYNFVYGYNNINFGIALVFLLIFIFSHFFKESEAMSILSFISLNITSLAMYSELENSLFYGLLTISGLTLIFSLLLSKLKNINLKSYILYSEIVIFIITLTNHMHYTNYILFINVFIFALSYLSVIKFHNLKWWRLAYNMLGLFTVIRVINTLLDPIVIASIISIIVVLIIIVFMYLLEIEDNISLALLSLITLYPYYNLIGNTYADVTELYLLPLIVYNIVFTEIIKFKKEETKKLWTIIPLSILSYLFIVIGYGIPSIIIDIVLALVFILLGLYRKYNYLLYFGAIFIAVTLFVRLFTILDSIALVIMLIVIGFILIGTALFIELRKKK